LFVSQAVVGEASRGDAAVAAKRTARLCGVSVLELSAGDAIHIAVAAVNQVNCLPTWSCTHIANAAVRGKIEEACRSRGLQAPLICTPEELMEV